MIDNFCKLHSGLRAALHHTIPPLTGADTFVSMSATLSIDNEKSPCNFAMSLLKQILFSATYFGRETKQKGAGNVRLWLSKLLP